MGKTRSGVLLSSQGHQTDSFGSDTLITDPANVAMMEELCNQAGIKTINPTDEVPQSSALELLSAELAEKHNVLPIRIEHRCLVVAMADPFDNRAIQEIRLVASMPIKKLYATLVSIEKALTKYYGSNVSRMLKNLAPEELGFEGADQELNPKLLQEMARQPSLVNLVNIILLEAIEERASDIHIEPFESTVKVKYRIDGTLIEKSPSPIKLHSAIVSRIKIMADMDIAERFVPQDGHIEFAGPRGKIDLRVSTVPTNYGESLTLRILDKNAALIGLEQLGMNKHSLDVFGQSLKKSHGIILVTGPTGSGKTTTLYAALNKIYDPSLKIITIEDPVEYQLPGIIQMPVNPKRGLTFARGLRHILRQDPDIIMVGEIRDRETADIAIRAALTGHLVFSTLHTNNAPGAITRLIDMGVEPFLLSSSLETVIAQRLARKLCPTCRKVCESNHNAMEGLKNSIEIPTDAKLFEESGCENCRHTGFEGRVGVFEVLRITDKLRQVINNDCSVEKIVKNGPADYHTMRHDGIEKIIDGITTGREIFRVTQESEEE